MSIWGKLIGETAGKIVDGAGKIVDEVISTDEEKLKLKAELSKIVMSNLSELSKSQRDVLVKEMDGNWLQKSWRPIVMLTFAGIVVMSFFKGGIDSMPEPFWDLLKLGIGGYVIGRSTEKIADRVTKNIDLSFLKKKNRKI